jgi:hypothetical protein
VERKIDSLQESENQLRAVDSRRVGVANRKKCRSQQDKQTAEEVDMTTHDR